MAQILAPELKSPPPPLGAAVLQQQFRSSPYWSVRQLICGSDGGYVTIRGTLPSYYLKQLVQSIAIKAVGNDRLHSDIDVQPE